MKQAARKKIFAPKFPNRLNLDKTVVVDTLVIGSGPAALGFLINALKSGRLQGLIRSRENGNFNNNGLAIIDEGVSLGGGQLGNYGINSNTSAIGFLKCIKRQVAKKKPLYT